jgi:hypothetical protein
MVGESPGSEGFRWRARDWLAALALFSTTAGVILWQNAHVAVLYDIGYVLDSAARIAAGQMPYRDFPFAHAPLTFLVQAAIIRLTGRVFFHQVIYVALVGGASTVLAWRLVFDTLRERIKAGPNTVSAVAFLLAAPLTVLGIYCILPNPEYDCDCAFWILIAIWALRRIEYGCPALAGSLSFRLGWGAKSTSHENPFGSGLCGFFAGCALCVPLFFKQNMGLPFLAAAIGAILMVLGVRRFAPAKAQNARPDSRALLWLLIGASFSLLAAALALHSTAGIGNYLHWTMGFAAQRRLPGFATIVGIYSDPSLAWTLPCTVAGLILLRVARGKRRWLPMIAFALLAAPFVFTLASLPIYDDADDRATALLELWPLLLLIAIILALTNLLAQWKNLSVRALVPLLLLAAIHGTFLSQQVWGSTYAIWPLLALLLAEMIAFLADLTMRNIGARWFAPALAAAIGITLVVSGGFYTASEERLSYASLSGGPAQHSAFPELAGLSTPGPYLPEFDELLRYAQANIPWNDGLILVPGEEPFFFATGRVPRFPLTEFDSTSDPYSPAEVGALVQSRGIRWLIVKRDLQIKEDPTPDRAETMSVLMHEFTLAAHLRGYDVYRR